MLSDERVMTRESILKLLHDELLFIGGHVAHISAYYERRRLNRISQERERLYASSLRRSMSGFNRIS